MTDNLAKARAAKAALAAQRTAEQTETDTGHEPVVEPVADPAPAPEPKPVAAPAAKVTLDAQPHKEVPHTPAADAMPRKVNDESVVEVELLKAYAPEFIEDDMGKLVEQGEIKRKVPVGTVIRLPASEATRAMRLQIALPTANTFAK